MSLFSNDIFCLTFCSVSVLHCSGSFVVVVVYVVQQLFTD